MQKGLRWSLVFAVRASGRVAAEAVRHRSDRACAEAPIPRIRCMDFRKCTILNRPPADLPTVGPSCRYRPNPSPFPERRSVRFAEELTTFASDTSPRDFCGRSDVRTTAHSCADIGCRSRGRSAYFRDGNDLPRHGCAPARSSCSANATALLTARNKSRSIAARTPTPKGSRTCRLVPHRSSAGTATSAALMLGGGAADRTPPNAVREPYPTEFPWGCSQPNHLYRTPIEKFPGHHPPVVPITCITAYGDVRDGSTFDSPGVGCRVRHLGSGSIQCPRRQLTVMLSEICLSKASTLLRKCVSAKSSSAVLLCTRYSLKGTVRSMEESYVGKVAPPTLIEMAP